MEKNFGKFILVVDDSVDNQNLLKLLLQSTGFQVKCASNGMEALDLLRELNTFPDLILLDLQMPLMDGYEFRKEQKMNLKIKNIPVIIMSGSEDTANFENLLAPAGILAKPLNIATILDTISKYL